MFIQLWDIRLRFSILFFKKKKKYIFYITISNLVAFRQKWHETQVQKPLTLGMFILIYLNDWLHLKLSSFNYVNTKNTYSL